MISDMTKRVSVIIPYYQKKPGILQNAVRSAINQKGIVDLDIIVVDDGSPAPAEPELAPFLSAPAGRYPNLTILHQENAGASAARNRGLDSVAADTEYVAFLDSDDQWTENHLANGLSALESGFDFYFSDLVTTRPGVSLFQSARFDATEHRILDQARSLYAYEGDILSQIAQRNVANTSTVIYRYGAFKNERFPEDFRFYEDLMFWASILKKRQRVVFCSTAECSKGHGINVSASGEWGESGSLERIVTEIRFVRSIEKISPVNKKRTKICIKRISRIRNKFVVEILHRISKKMEVDKKLIYTFFRNDPALIAYFLPTALSAVASKHRQPPKEDP